ncbi:ATP synthase F1 subunit delta [Rhodohalobacter sp. 614A]|uniref:ATP synthase F1 subunit delta n=1 Tax=Rhodohalobacter sp. 614A TaxID=2908649 RepID=UPI001F3379E6|nr:ATP synthase F1 subunit delta [Rhodohalobacter sp. 614A]
MSTKAARRYANAFLEIAIEQDTLEKAREDMLLIKNTIGASDELRLFLKNPIVKKDQKKKAVEAIFKDKVQDITLQLYELLSKKDRESLFEDISKNFIELYNRHKGIIEVSVTSANKLEKAQLEALRKSIEQTTGKKVEFKTEVDEELIGGLKYRIDDTVVDGSVKFKLNQLKHRLTSTAVE